MSQTIVFGLGGYCQDCDPSHDHPLNNIVEVVEMPDKDESESSETSVEGVE
jgi:hypothetical protein